MTTTLRGAPIIGLPSGTLPIIKATLRYTRDYAGGVLGGLGAGSHEIEYVWPATGEGVDMFAGNWRHVISQALVKVAAAPFAGGGVQPEGVIFIGGSIKYATGNAQPFELRRLPVETSAGVMDLRALVNPPAYTTPQSLEDLMGSLEGLDASVAAGLVTLETGLAEIAVAQTTANAAVARLAGFSFKSTPGTYIGGVQALLTLEDAAGHVVSYWDANGQQRNTVGLTVPSLTVLNGLGLDGAKITSLPSGTYMGGYEVAALIYQDATGRAPIAILRDGRVYFPAGVAGLNLSGITTDSDGGVRINSVRAVSSKDIVCAGDSLSEGAGGTPYPTALASKPGMSGRTITNLGIGGQNSAEIAARVAGITLTVSGNSIPASGGVTVTPVGVDLLRSSGARSLAGTLAGVPGTLSRTASSASFGGVYTFTRTTPGSAIATSISGMPFLPDIPLAQREAIWIIKVGRNDVSDVAMTDNVLAAVRRIVSRLRALHVRFLVSSVWNADTEYTGGPDQTKYLRVLATNQALQREYPQFYVDDRSQLAAGTTDDVIPSSLRSDNLHGNTAGYDVLATIYAGEINTRGW